MNTGPIQRPAYPLEAEALEARFGLRVAARLNEGTQTLSHDVTERLRVARQQALERAAARRLVAAPAASADDIVAVGNNSAALHWPDANPGQRSPWLTALGTLVPVLLLLAGLLFISHWRDREQIATTADIDSALLGDDLPPAAFTDPGFVEFLLEPQTEHPLEANAEPASLGPADDMRE
ncbi:DUF3619 family protein [Sphaerotilus mobilis]|uniref:Uncharacterized protein DUF3619 n=1 Tax=Sphaerotilus mobilis TaxID=47994 RepID=A0A4Q7LVU5_9BURK|nr:DUF3619 family protein [Sphaerotilus mobilis]RZS58683.1 uncharacterized protein DUF3619 [Sphaerotilus mobilis]